MKTKTLKATVTKGEQRSFRFVVSSESVDRDLDTMNPAGMSLDEFRANPVVLLGHDHTKPIARAVNTRVEGGKLLSTAIFPPKGTSQLSDEVFALIDEGILRSASVGFQPVELTPNDKGGFSID